MTNAYAQETPLSEHAVKVSWRWSTAIVSALLIGMAAPMLFMDICLEIYHRIGFPLLRIPTVRRRDYIKVDRQRLPYLPAILKLACAYCGYANGLAQYAARIAGETEAYFCPIKHQAAAGFHPPPHHRAFAEYGDAEGFRRCWQGLWGQTAPKNDVPKSERAKPKKVEVKVG